jgi:predicted MPP superfamily phosphohydrolase
VDSRRTNIDRTVSFVRQAAEIAPCYYVTGNHEGRLSPEDYTAFEEALLSLGVTVLHGESVTLERGGETVTVAGIDSPLFDHNGHSAHGGSATPDLSALCKDGYTILLAHHPEFVTDYAHAGADLVFSGHVHGGQFRLPFVGGLYGPGQGIFPTYDAGLYRVSADGHDTLLYVHRGLGNSRFPIRFANRPEVVLAVLKTQ